MLVSACDGKAPVSKHYRLGDVMHDFTILTSDNHEFTFSEVLEDKNGISQFLDNLARTL